MGRYKMRLVCNRRAQKGEVVVMEVLTRKIDGVRLVAWLVDVALASAIHRVSSVLFYQVAVHMTF